MSSQPKNTEHIENMCEKTKIKTIMKTAVVKIHQDEDFSRAQIKFLNHHISHLLVVNDREKLVGTLSHKYLYRAQSPRRVLDGMDIGSVPGTLADGGDSFYFKETLDAYILKNIMKPKPFTLDPEASVKEALINMSEKKLGCIPVIDKEKKVCGILTEHDLINFVANIV